MSARATEDPGWLILGGGFPEPDPDPENRRLRLMSVVSMANQYLNRQVDVGAWRDASGLDALCLVLRHRASVAEPDLQPVGGVEDGVRTFEVTYNWLADEFLDRNRGPWQMVALVLLSLTTISAGADIPLPELRALPS